MYFVLFLAPPSTYAAAKRLTLRGPAELEASKAKLAETEELLKASTDTHISIQRTIADQMKEVEASKAALAEKDAALKVNYAIYSVDIAKQCSENKHVCICRELHQCWIWRDLPRKAIACLLKHIFDKRVDHSSALWDKVNSMSMIYIVIFDHCAVWASWSFKYLTAQFC